ncbi:MAG: M14 family zinc carboxypeptidase [bacterium]
MILLLFLLSLDPRYHTFDKLALELDSISIQYPKITKLDTIGYSTNDSMAIFALKISDNAKVDEDEPEILYVACHHAEEVLGIEICMFMINELITGYQIDPRITEWINEREIWFVPLLNPEGHAIVTQGIDTTWRKNKRDNNNNGSFDLTYDGVDLNRNYDFYWTSGGSTDPPSEYYRGPYPWSENEVCALRDLCLSRNFSVCITYHSARTGLGEVVYYPWRAAGYYSPDYPFIREIADSLSKTIVNEVGNGHYVALPGIGVDGRARNWIYGVCGTFCYCVEVCTTTIIPGSMVDDVCQRNIVGAHYLLDRVTGSGITGCVYDSLTGEPLHAEITIDGFYDPTLPPRMSDKLYGRFLRMINDGSYDIQIHKNGYESKYLNNIIVEPDIMTEIEVFLRKKESNSLIFKNKPDILVFPNPTRNAMTIYIENPNQFSSLKVYDVNGRMLRDFDNPSSTTVVWLSKDSQNRDLANGIYYIVGETNVQRLTRKIVINN